MHSTTLTLATLLATATASSSHAALNALVSRQLPTTGDSCFDGALNACSDPTAANVEANCRSALCSNTCLTSYPVLSSCCKSASDLTALANCFYEIDPDSITATGAAGTGGAATATAATTSASRTTAGGAGTTTRATVTSTNLSTAPGAGGVSTQSSGAPAATNSPSGTVVVSVQTNAQGQPTNTVTKTGGVERMAAAGQLGVVGSMAAWALGLLLI